MSKMLQNILLSGKNNTRYGFSVPELPSSLTAAQYVNVSMKRNDMIDTLVALEQLQKMPKHDIDFRRIEDITGILIASNETAAEIAQKTLIPLYKNAFEEKRNTFLTSLIASGISADQAIDHCDIILKNVTESVSKQTSNSVSL